MIKSELIEKIAGELTYLPEKQVADAVNHMLELMSGALTEGKRIEIRGFGSFSLHRRRSRNAHNPKTGAKVITMEKDVPHFKPGKELRERVDASRSLCALKDQDAD